MYDDDDEHPTSNDTQRLVDENIRLKQECDMLRKELNEAMLLQQQSMRDTEDMLHVIKRFYDMQESVMDSVNQMDSCVSMANSMNNNSSSSENSSLNVLRENLRLSRQVRQQEEALAAKDNIVRRMTELLSHVTQRIKREEERVEKIVGIQCQCVNDAVCSCRKLQTSQKQILQQLRDVDCAQGVSDSMRVARILSPNHNESLHSLSGGEHDHVLEGDNENHHDDIEQQPLVVHHSNDDSKSSSKETGVHSESVVVAQLRDELDRLNRVRAETNAKAHRLAAEKQEIFSKYIAQERSIHELRSALSYSYLPATPTRSAMRNRDQSRERISAWRDSTTHLSSFYLTHQSAQQHSQQH